MFYNKKEIKSSSVVLIQHLCNKPLNLLSFYMYDFYGLNPKDVFPGVLKGAAKLANSHNNRLVSRGSIISSARKDSAVLNGDLTISILYSISSNNLSGSSDFSKSDLKAASIPPSIGSDPQSPDGQANL